MTVRDAIKYVLLFFELQEEENWMQLSNTVQYGIAKNLHRLGAFVAEWSTISVAWKSDIQEMLETATGSIYVDRERLEIDVAYQQQLEALETQFIAANPELQAYLLQPVAYQIYTIDQADIEYFIDKDFLITEFPEVFVTSLN